MAVRYANPPTSLAERMRRQRFETFMQGYWTGREAWCLAAESATNTQVGWGTSEELDSYMRDNPPPLFRDYLTASRGCPR